ncbi:hypothetical protein [Paenibacillus sp. USHLN196]|uniref:hypothetical protein n=1 Tax=Paenibacillus sp. USHLN196 TaxID=3081291 RepID=UPI003019EF0F
MNKEKLIDQLREDFPSRRYFDCMGCDNSFSTDDNRLHCMIKDRIVEEDELCEQFG